MSCGDLVAPGTRPVPPRGLPNGRAIVGMRDDTVWDDTSRGGARTRAG